MTDDTQQVSTARLLDRSDERVKHADTLGNMIGAFVDRVRSGDLGSLPVVVGLIVICAAFETSTLFFSRRTIWSICFSIARQWV